MRVITPSNNMSKRSNFDNLKYRQLQEQSLRNGAGQVKQLRPRVNSAALRAQVNINSALASTNPLAAALVRAARAGN